MYSWMNPGNVEDDDEYQVSKCLLEKFICSQAVLEVVDGNSIIIVKILKFLRLHVYTWETLYLHYARKNVRHFDTSHSSPHEGTNHGLKSHSAAVKATMNVDLSAKTLNTQTSIKVAECNELIYQEAICTHKKWSQLPTSAFLVAVADGILQEVRQRVDQYHTCLVSPTISTSECKTETVFQVSYIGGDQAHNSSLFPEHSSGDESIDSTNSILEDLNTDVCPIP
jgi:hypothetical protein